MLFLRNQSLFIAKKYNLLLKPKINRFISSIGDVELSFKEVSFEYESRTPFIYDIKYMNQVVLFGINIYILPLYPEFINLNNIVYYLKNSSNNLDLSDEKYIIKIKTNIINEEYDIYFSFNGEWLL